MNIELLHSLLEAWPGDEAVRVCDANGSVVAQNGRALEAAARSCEPEDTCDGEFWKNGRARERTLPGGWHLQARPNTPSPSDERRSEDRLSDKPIEVQTLSRGIVHELRNPLAAIVTAAGLLQDEPNAGEETLMLLGVIRKESHRMNRILSEFSAYVKPRPPQPAPFDLVEGVRQEAADMMRSRSDEAGPIEIHDHLPEHLMVVADEEHLREVLHHVLHNASEAMPRGGSLRLEVRLEGRRARLMLADSGTGLSTEALALAFQPFFSSKAQSTGLGLSIARSAVEASGGRMWIENGGDSPGARVFIDLPSAKDASTSANPSTQGEADEVAQAVLV
jgi:signal transduction histidine kinase